VGQDNHCAVKDTTAWSEDYSAMQTDCMSACGLLDGVECGR